MGISLLSSVGCTFNSSMAQWLMFHSSRLAVRQVDFIESLGLGLVAIFAGIDLDLALLDIATLSLGRLAREEPLFKLLSLEGPPVVPESVFLHVKVKKEKRPLWSAE